jgi:FRG domain
VTCVMMENQCSITEIRINSLGDLIDALTPAEPDAKTGRRRDVGIYRGMCDPDWPLLTSLDQLGGVNPPHTKADVEEHVLRNFIRYSRPHLTSASVNEWELLVLAQHHGLPTRLLDWSYSPLVAAHFATVNGKHDSDRVVWRLDWQMVHRKFGLPELALLIEDIQRLFREDEPFTPWKLMREETAARDFACMIEPPSLDSRIEAQSAVFSLCSDKRRSLADFLTDYCLADALTRFIIPAAEVARIRDQLDLVGIDERLIFPDLDGVAAKIRRYYS